MLLIGSVVVSPAVAAEENGKTFLIHAKTALKIDDPRIRAVPLRQARGDLQGREG
jgi:hypothetical protein